MVRVVGRRDAAEGLHRIGIELRRILRAAEMAPEPLRMVGIEPHRLADPLDPFLRPPEPGQHLALLHHDQVAVRIEAQRPLLMVLRLLEVVVVQVQRREDAVDVGVVVVERQRGVELFLDLLEAGVLVLAPAVDPALAEHAGLPGMRVRVVRVELDRPLQHAQRLGIGVARRPVVQHFAGQHVFVGRHVRRRLALGALLRRRLDAAAQRRDDGRRHLVLDGKDVLQLAVVALRPDMRLGLAVDELHGDAHAIRRLAHAAFDHVVDAEVPRDLLQLHRLALVHEHGVAGDDEQVAEARQLGDDVLGQPVGEELLFRVAAHVEEGQHGDGRDGSCLLRDGRRLPPGRRLVAENHAEHADRPRDVLHDLLAEILEPDVEPVADLVAHRARHADAARFRQPFQPRRDVHAVAKNVAVLDDDVAEIDADAELDVAGRGDVGIAPRHAALHLRRAQNGVGDALELDQHAVAGGLDDAPAILGDCRIDELEPVGLQARERALLIDLHEAAVADDVRRHDRGEPALDARTLHRLVLVWTGAECISRAGRHKQAVSRERCASFAPAGERSTEGMAPPRVWLTYYGPAGTSGYTMTAKSVAGFAALPTKSVAQGVGRPRPGGAQPSLIGGIGAGGRIGPARKISHAAAHLESLARVVARGAARPLGGACHPRRPWPCRRAGARDDGAARRACRSRAASPSAPTRRALRW